MQSIQSYIMSLEAWMNFTFTSHFLLRRTFQEYAIIYSCHSCHYIFLLSVEIADKGCCLFSNCSFLTLTQFPQWTGSPSMSFRPLNFVYLVVYVTFLSLW